MPNLAIYPTAVEYPTGLVGTASRLFYFSEDYSELSRGLSLWSVDPATGVGSVVSSFTDEDIRSSDQIRLGERLLFSLDNDTSGGELWVSDGTASGTVRLYSYNSYRSAGRSEPRSLTAVGNAAYFFAESPEGTALWRTDGTPAGTRRLKATGGYSNGDIVAINNTIYFQANGQLWQSDGTEAGTTILRTSQAGWIDDDLWALNGNLLFKQSQSQDPYGSSSRYELWRLDGVSQGITQVSSVAPTETSYGSEPRAVGGTLYFAGQDDAGVELWRTDGTAAGTTRVKDINPGAVGSDLNSFDVAGSLLYFQASDGDTKSPGYDLWRSDGTESGTFKLFERPYWQSIYPTTTKGFEGKLYFQGEEIDRNRNLSFNLWVSDGSVEGTQPLLPDDSGTTLSQPGSFATAGEFLFFMASDGTTRRLFRLDNQPPSDQVRVSSQVPAETPDLFGNDAVLSGSSTGRDVVTGTDWNDVLGAGIGPDELTGGQGADIFAFYTRDSFDQNGADRISDFNPGEGDTIWLSPLALPGLSLISLKVASSKKAFKKALKSKESLIYDLGSGALFFNANGKGKGLGDGGLLAILDGSPSLNSFSFNLFG